MSGRNTLPDVMLPILATVMHNTSCVAKLGVITHPPEALPPYRQLQYEKCCLFDDAMTLMLHDSEGQENNDAIDSDDSDNDSDNDPVASHPAAVLADLWGPKRQTTNFFEVAERDKMASASKVWPPRSFTSGSVAIHLNFDPSYSRISIDQATRLFSLPDLRRLLTTYFNKQRQSSGNMLRDASEYSLPFNYIQVWFKVRVQQKSFHDDSIIGPTFTINTHPPNRHWKHGRYDAAIFAVGGSDIWPKSGLTGHIVAQVHMIFCPIPPRGTHPVWASQFLACIQPFNILSNGNVDPATRMYTLKRSMRSRGTERVTDIIFLDKIRSYTHIIPKFGKEADCRLTLANVLHFADMFYLNHFFDKDFFFAISQ
ncbi:hypothetical protein JVT61DRAFT_6780 [Boletus reticuloceps]|uniref:DUF6830 domain-containing protein n=1 Tax=Boletus reticuloceps TaxID=495285 RepID=A0A8I3A667_9AGAM|nr:hypothetical protein JVT61DRAFT_6780 [Boletus reticuloceps]